MKKGLKFVCLLLTMLMISTQLVYAAAPTTDPRYATTHQAIILDTDIGNSTDDLFAMEILYKMMDAGLVDLKGVIVDRPGNGFTELADIENVYHGYPNIPIGVERNGILGTKVYIDYRMLDDLKNPDGSKMFARSDTDLSNNLDGYKLYRKLLAKEPDHSVKVILIGFVSSFVQFLESAPDEYSPLSGQALASQKIDSVYIMATKLGESNELGYNLRQDIPLAKRFVAELPSNVTTYLSPSPVGDALEYKPSEVLSDLSDVAVHPIKQTYMYKNCETGQRMWDHLCVLNAVFPGTFVYSERGDLTVNDDATVNFTPNPNGKFMYQRQGGDEWYAQHHEILRNYTKMKNKIK